MRGLGLWKRNALLRVGTSLLSGVVALVTLGVFDAPVPGVAGAAASVPTAAHLGAQPRAQVPTSAEGVPEGAEVLFSEDFQHRAPGSLLLLNGYTGATGQRYAADPYWSDVNRCNGFVLDVDTPYVRGACRSNTNVFNDLLLLVQTLGEYAHPHDKTAAEDNAALAAMTQLDTTPQRLMLRTETPISLGAEGRFVTMSVDAAAMNCDQRKPLLQFALTSGGITTPLSDGPMKTCELPNERVFKVGRFVKPVRFGTLVSNGAILLTDSSFDIKLENYETSGAGNDGAIDNIRILDVTPHLTKAFSPASVHVGERARLTYTLTNTSDLNAKRGWSFTDTLPAGLKLAAAPNAPASTCVAADVAALPGGTSISVTAGALSAGQRSCTVSVDVTSETPRGAEPSPKSYTSDASQVTPAVGVKPMGDAKVEFFSAPNLSIKKTSDAKTTTRVGDTVTYRVTATNTGSGDYQDTGTPILVDDLTGVLDDAKLDSSTIAVAKRGMLASFDAARKRIEVTGPLAVGESFTLRYAVQLVAANGDRVLKNTAFQADLERPNGEAPDCAPSDTASPGAACTAHPFPYLSVTKQSDAHAKPAPGDVVTYTVTARNTGKAAFARSAPAVLTDDLTAALDDGAYQDDATASLTTAGLEYANSRLTWSGPLRAGQSVTLQYSVKLGGHGDGTVRNIAFVGSGSTPRCDDTAASLGTCAVLEHSMVRPSLSWQKVAVGQGEASSSALLGGSVWQLTPLDAHGNDQADQAITITDCVASDPAPGSAPGSASCDSADRDPADRDPATSTPVDRDPAKGKLRLEGLAPGSYKLYEAKAPAGYQRLAQPIAVEIPRSDDSVALGAISNEQRTVPAVPLTGGLGELTFWIATAAAALMAAAVFGVRRHHQHPRYQRRGRGY